ITELTPQIFAWLGLLDMNVWIILGLMLAVAAFSMVSGLLIIILERTNMIGILKALGASNTQMRKVFLHFSVFVIGKGMVFGNVIGLGICLVQKYTGLIHLNPQNYYVDSVPIIMNIPLILLLNVGTFVISMIVLIAPSYMVSRILPAKSIRFE
ncbi:MAG: FtsX-like permease family protein, partial [Bacteroidaceae bacterium]|nr:FtsX-like permease family protein [Bacteroidaceae bacterium]